MAKTANYIRAAFLVPANLVAVSAASAYSVATGDPIPALVAGGVEAIYLGVVSSLKGFRRAVRARALAEPVELTDEVTALLEELAPSQREHFFALRDLKDQILANYRRLPGGKVLATASEQRLDTLLLAFLRLFSTLNNYRKYLGITDRKHIEAERDALRTEAEGETSPRIKEIKLKRVEILDRRLQRFEQAEEGREVVSHQLASIEDLLRLTHEQSIAIRDPASVSRQLDALSAEVSATDETVREMERFMELNEEVASLPSGIRVP